MRNQRTENTGKSARCRVCGHPDRYRYDKAIALGTMTRADVARELRVHRSSVARHFTHHAEPSLSDQLANDPQLSATNIVDEIKRICLLTEEGRLEATRRNDLHAVRGFLRDQRGIIELVLKLSERSDYQPVIDPVAAAAEMERRGAEARRFIEAKLEAYAQRQSEKGSP